MGAEPTALGPTGPDPGPLTGKRIIITRSVEDNVSLAAELQRNGAEVYELPLVGVLPPLDDGAALADAVARLADYDWVVLTSTNAVAALVEALADTPWPAGVTVSPVGPTTAAAARAAGMLVGPAPQTATAAALVEAFPSAAESQTNAVLAPLAELASSTVVDGLAAKGYRVDRLTAYRTAAPAADGPELDPVVHNGQIIDCDAVTFFSPSAVDRYVALPGCTASGSDEPIPALAFCIGPSTGERATEKGFAEVIVPFVHSQAEVVKAICDRLSVSG